MSSERKLRSERANGLAARDVVLDIESAEDFDALRDSCIRELSPATPVETALVDDYVAARWRLQRARAIDTALLNLEVVRTEEKVDELYESITPQARAAYAFRSLCDHSKAIERLIRYEARDRRIMDKALAALRVLRENRNLRNEPNPKNGHSSDMT